MAIYRGERWELSYGVESTYGAAPTGALTATNLFGVFEDATLPDPEFEHTQHWFQNPSYRNYTLAYKGKARSVGSIPDITLLDGRPLFLPISDDIDHNQIQGAVADDGGSMTDEITAARNATANDMTLLPATPAQEDAYYFGSYAKFGGITINVGTAGAGTWTITWEYYNGSTWASLAGVSDGTTGFTTGGSNDVTWTVPSAWDHTNVNSHDMYWVRARVSAYTGITTQPKGTQVTATAVVASGYYNHIIPGHDDSNNLSSIRVVATNYPETGTTAGLCRWFVGGKANRVTYSCEEGDLLKMSLDEMIFKMPYFEDDDATTSLTPWYDADADKQTLTLPTTEPYYFSYGALKMRLAKDSLSEIAIPNVKNFRLEVNNNLEPKYYIMTNDEKVPYEIHEGRREYRLSFLVDLVDVTSGIDKNDLWMELVNQGADTTLKGSGVELTFTRGTNDYIQFRMPSDYYPSMAANDQGALIIRAPHNIVTEGVVSVPVEMIVPDLVIVVSDQIANTSYPIT